MVYNYKKLGKTNHNKNDMKYRFLVIRYKQKKLIPILACMLMFFNCKKTPVQEHSIKAVLWQQTAGEYKALTYQAFNLAKLQLDKIIEDEKQSKKPLAIITDIDETVLDNSPYFAKMIQLDKNFSKKMWVEWGRQKKAKPVHGALEFFKYAENKGVEVFYISNRYESQLSETITNLKNIGFPFANKEHTYLKKETSSKVSRRNIVASTHNVVMLLGDNLSDFISVFEKKAARGRNDAVEQIKLEFGKKFIVLPNPIYGDWENYGLYEGKYGWTPFQKDSIRRSKLISY